MNFKHLLSFLLIASGIFCAQTCKNSVEPPSPVQPTDTTSHDFIIVRLDTLGDAFSSVNAVDIINERDIWAVGMFTERDTNGEILYSKNLAHWDGNVWKKYGVEIQGSGGQRDTFTQILVNIRAFTDSSIFVISRYNSYAQFDGTRWISSFVDPTIGYVQAMWTRSVDDIFFVGERGSASHWNGRSFTKMPTVLSNPPLLDVWGNESSVYAVGSPGSVDQGEQSVFLHYSGTSWSKVNECNVVTRSAAPPNQYIGSMTSVYQNTAQGTLWLLAGTNGWAVCKVTSLAPFHAEQVHDIGDGFYPSVIRGNGDNDIFVAGSRNGQFLHYNGSTWMNFVPSIAGRTGPFAVKGNVCVIGGKLDGILGRGVVVICKRPQRLKGGT